MHVAFYALAFWTAILIHVAPSAAFPHQSHPSLLHRAHSSSRRASGSRSMGPSIKPRRRPLATRVDIIYGGRDSALFRAWPEETGSSAGTPDAGRSTLVKRGYRLSKENLQKMNERRPWSADSHPSYRPDDGSYPESEGTLLDQKSSRRACVFGRKKKSVRYQECEDKRRGRRLDEAQEKRTHASRHHRSDHEKDGHRKSVRQGKRYHTNHVRNHYHSITSQESGMDRSEGGSPHSAGAMKDVSSRPNLNQAMKGDHEDLAANVRNPNVPAFSKKHDKLSQFSLSGEVEAALRRQSSSHHQVHHRSGPRKQRAKKIKDSAEDLVGHKRPTIPALHKDEKAAGHSVDPAGPQGKEKNSNEPKDDEKRGMYHRLDRILKWSLLTTAIGVCHVPRNSPSKLNRAEGAPKVDRGDQEPRPGPTTFHFIEPLRASLIIGRQVGGSVPAMIQAHGYAAQARAQQQSANAVTAAMIHNGTETPDGEHTTTPNGTVIEVPRLQNATKSYSRRRSLEYLTQSLRRRGTRLL